MKDSLNRLAVFRELTVNYVPEGGPQIVAVDNVSLAIEAGQIVGVTAESGSGKSTLAAALLQLLPDSAVCRGSIRFEEQELLVMGEQELRTLRGAQISLVPQDPAVCLNPVIKVGEQIVEVLRAHLKMTSGQRKNHALDLLREVGFDDPKQILRFVFTPAERRSMTAGGDRAGDGLPPQAGGRRRAHEQA